MNKKKSQPAKVANRTCLVLCFILISLLSFWCDKQNALDELAGLMTGSFSGAAYATTEVQITPDRIISWDRGFDHEDRQVWGAEKGGYAFDRLR